MRCKKRPERVAIGVSHNDQKCFVRAALTARGLDGVVVETADGRVQGSYLHGLFSSDDFRRAWLARLGVSSFGEGYSARMESALDALAGHIEKHLDVEGILALAR